MKKLYILLRAKNLFTALIFIGLFFSCIHADADPKRGRTHRKRYGQGIAEDYFRIGPIVGGNKTNVEGGATFDNQDKYGFHAGVVANIALAPIIVFEPQLIYTQKGVQFHATGTKLNLNYAELRLYGKLLLSKRVSLLLGPNFGLLMSANYAYPGGSTNEKDLFSPFDFGMNGAIEYQLPVGLGLGFHYSIGLADINTNGPTGDNLPSRTNSAMQLSLFYLIGPK